MSNIKNWKPISLLHVDTKVLSKAISKKLKGVLSTLISSQQTVKMLKTKLLKKLVD